MFKDKRNKEVNINELSSIKMVSGNEKKYSYVIQDGVLKNWIGIGWIEERKASKRDYDKYPVVKN